MKKALLTVLIVILSVFVFVFANGVYYVFSGQFRTMDKINHHTPISLYEKSSIYTMHMAIYTLGWSISKEAAFCNFLMALPRHQDTVFYETDCWLTPKVVKRIRNNEFGEVTWSGNPHNGHMGDYDPESSEHRAAILLNWCTISETPDYYLAACDYTYKVQSATQFRVVKNFKIVINESLFYELEKCGWLHPYKLICYCTKDKINGK